MFWNALNKYKIVEYEPAVGEKVDKVKMKVVGQQESEDPKQVKGTIAKINRKGWQIEGKPIKPAEVVIYK